MDIKERIESVLKAEANAINSIEVTEEFVKAVSVMQGCTGKIITTGTVSYTHLTLPTKA